MYHVGHKYTQRGKSLLKIVPYDIYITFNYAVSNRASLFYFLLSPSVRNALLIYLFLGAPAIHTNIYSFVMKAKKSAVREETKSKTSF